MKNQFSSKISEDIHLFLDGKVKTQLQMANFLGVNVRTLQRWLKKEGFKTKHKLMSPVEQIEIFKLLGYINE